MEKEVIGDCTIYNGDCLEIMPTLESASIDLVLTDPPYNMTNCEWDKLIPFDKMWNCLDKITKETTPICLFGSEPFSSALRMSNIKNYKYDWIWYKNFSSSFAIAKKRPMKYHEIISVFYRKQCSYYPQFEEYSDSVKKRFKDGEKVNFEKQNKNPTNEIYGGLHLGTGVIDFKRGKYPEDVLKFKVVPNCNGNRLHPTQKPTDLLEYLIKTYTNEGDLVLDFTSGSFSTAIACLNTKRKFIGIELDTNYYEIGKKRIKDWYENQKSIFDV